MRKLKFATGGSRPRRSFKRDEEILSLGQEIGILKNRLGDIETGVTKLGSLIQPSQEANQLPKSLEIVRNIKVPESPVQPIPEVDQVSKSLDVVKNIGVSETPVQPKPQGDQLSRSLDVVKNIGNLKISESDSTYEKEKPLEMEEEMEMEA